MIVAADDVRDPHVEVVDDDAEVVGRRAVGTRDHEIVELGVGDLDAPLDPSSQTTLPASGFRNRITGATPAGGDLPTAFSGRQRPS